MTEIYCSELSALRSSLWVSLSLWPQASELEEHWACKGEPKLLKTNAWLLVGCQRLKRTWCFSHSVMVRTNQRKLFFMVRICLYFHCLVTKYAPNVAYPKYNKYIYSALLNNGESHHLLFPFLHTWLLLGFLCWLRQS